MAEQYYESPRNITVGGVNVEITFGRLNMKDKSDIKNFFQKYSLGQDEGNLEGIDLPAGGIEQLFIRRGLQGLRVGNRNIPLDTGSNLLASIPDVGMGDDPDDVDLYDELLKTGVDKNRWIAVRFPFNMVFAQYLQQINNDKAENEKSAQEKAEEEGRNIPKGDPNTPANGVGEDPLDTQEDTSSVTVLSGSDILGKQQD
jgi:hypothetical protein